MTIDFRTTYESPVGTLTLVGGRDGLRALSFPGRGARRGRSPDEAAGSPARDAAPLASALAQLDQYFAGERRAFELTLVLEGTAFQREVWAQVARIPYGETTSYGAIARTIGRVDRVRAVAGAVGRTPVPIIVPCHRVVGADGELVGYGGGLDRKLALLELEAAVAGGEPLPGVWRTRQLALL